jgi:SAM-dependent methyltransferase
MGPDTAPFSASAEAAYDEFAPYYDAFTARYDHEAWFAEVLPAVRALGLSGKRALDVACGTGKSFLPLRARGWQVTACDISAEMLARASAKADARVKLVLADLRTLPVLGSFDLVTCLDDALNYVADAGELVAALCGFRRNLNPSGRLVVDVNTLRTYRSFFAETQVVAAGSVTVRWIGHESDRFEPGAIAEATLETRDGSGGPSRSLHRQRHFPADELVAALGRAGLEPLALYGHGLDGKLEQPADELRHTKAVLIARRKSEVERG